MAFGFFRNKNRKPKEAPAAPNDSDDPLTGGKKAFEDAFMEIQEGSLALCMEFAGDAKVDEVYAYGSIEEDAYSFNAFYVKQGQVLPAHKINEDLPTIRQFLQIGTQDLIRLEKTCREYGRPVPTELRLHYTVDGGHLDAHYEYRSVCSKESGLSPMLVFREWRESVEKELEQP